MNLRAQMAEDACAILNTDELGEQVTWTNSAGAALSRTVRVIEQAERQTVRRAHIWTPRVTTTVSPGDTFRLRRGADVSTWVVQYSDPAETGLQRHYCHEQLSETVTLTRRQPQGTRAGQRRYIDSSKDTAVRAKWFQSSAELTTTEDGKRRRMAGEFYLMLQAIPENLAAMDLVQSGGRSYRITRLEQGFTRADLPYLILERSD